MLVNTKAIVLHTLKYSESSVILKCFTRELGLQSYIINGIKNKKSPVRSGATQALNILSLVTYHKGKGGLERIKELKVDYQYTNIPYDPIKTSICLFIAEVLYKSIKEESPDEELYEFITESLQWLDKHDEGYANFHILLLAKLTYFLGFGPMLSNDREYFDLTEGLFTENKPIHDSFVSGNMAVLLNQILGMKFADITDLKMNVLQRRELLQILLNYYSIHIDSFASIKSVKILEELFT